MDKMLEGRVAVITGSGNGIGRAEALGMAARGAKVVVDDIGTSPEGIGTSKVPADTVVKEIQDAGGTAIACYDTVMTQEGAKNIIDMAIDTYGRIDILVNDAGIVHGPRKVFEIPDDEWEGIVRTHLFGTFYCTRYACSFMSKQKYGRIINTSSHTGLGWKSFAAYGASKEGIAGLTRVVARDMAEYNVTCNAIRPLARWRGAKEISPEMQPNRPEDVASLVVYLASEKAAHINGCIFEVWHGHVGIFTEPPVIKKRIDKDDGFTAEELAEEIPKTLTKDLPEELNPSPL